MFLPAKKDKEEFDKVFDSVRLYTSYLENAANPIVVESVIVGVIFHNYKQLLQVSKEDSLVNEDSLREDLASLINNKPEGKILFYRISKKWHGFLYALHKEDRQLLLKMILEICSHDECVCTIINTCDSQSPIDYLFFLFAIIQQQKLIDKLNKTPGDAEITSTSTANRSLSDYMS